MSALQNTFAVLSEASYALAFRAVPLLGYALLARRVPGPGKLLALGLALVPAATFAALDQRPGDGPVAGLLCWLYLTAAAYAVHVLVAPLQRYGCTSAGLFVGALTLFLAIPALIFRDRATLLLLATGLELAFAAYSYWFELVRGRGPSHLGECLTFLLVNPTLVYPARGRDLGRAQASPRGFARVAAGVFGSYLSAFASIFVGVVPGALQAFLPRSFWSETALTVLFLNLQLWALYLAHASLASLQIGALRLLGHEIPERYNYPFMARSPEDLWRRWNIYLGAWLQRYVYLPLALRWQRRLPQARWALGKGVAVVTAFSLCGLMHEAAGYALRYTLPLGALLGFAFYGLVLVAWAASRRFLAHSRPSGHAHAGFRGMLGRLISRSASFATLVLFAALALPALSGMGLHPQIGSWLALEWLP